MKVNRLIYFFIPLIFIGCTQSDEQVKKAYYQSGQLKSEGTFRNGVQDGNYRIYYQNGNLKQRGKYNSGVLVDTVYDYFESGKIEVKTPYQNGKINGEAISFYDDGSVFSKVNFKDNNRYGDAYYYYKGGYAPKAYLYFAEDEEVTYRRDFNELGQLVKEKGLVFPIGIGINDVDFKVGEIFNAKLLPVSPPGCEIKVFVGEYDQLSGTLKTKTEVKRYEDEWFKYSTKFEKPGTYHWGAYVDLGCETLLSEKERTQEIKILVQL